MKLKRLLVGLCAVLTALAVGIGLSYGDPRASIQRTAEVEVKGKLIQERGLSRFSLSISYKSETFDTLGDALLVYAEPSHVLLFAHVNTRGRTKSLDDLGRELEPALARVYSPGQRFQHALILPYDPQKLRDTRIEVVMKSRGQDSVLASGNVNLLDFQYSTTFTVATYPDGSIEYLAGNHCCSGPRCSGVCANCPGAFFSCDLINCTITYESY